MLDFHISYFHEGVLIEPIQRRSSKFFEIINISTLLCFNLSRLRNLHYVKGQNMSIDILQFD
jgi:hypothetical protein